MDQYKPKVEKPLTLDRAYELFPAERIIGPREVEHVWGFEDGALAAKADDFPFSQEALERILAEDGIVQLGVEAAGDGSALTIDYMESQLMNDAIRLYGDDRRNTARGLWRNKELFTTETPRSGWSAFRSRPLQETLGKSIIEQTRALRDYGVDIKRITEPEYEQCSDETLTILARDLDDPKKKEATLTTLLALSVTQKMRRRAVDTYYSVATSLRASEKSALHSVHVDVTRTLYENGGKLFLISIGGGKKFSSLIWKLIDPIEIKKMEEYSIAGCMPYLG